MLNFGGDCLKCVIVSPLVSVESGMEQCLSHPRQNQSAANSAAAEAVKSIIPARASVNRASRGMQPGEQAGQAGRRPSRKSGAYEKAKAAAR